LIQELATRGEVILFSSHELETVERISSHVMILHKGKIVADDSMERLRTAKLGSLISAVFVAIPCAERFHRADLAYVVLSATRRSAWNYSFICGLLDIVARSRQVAELTANVRFEEATLSEINALALHGE
jgi:ABC-type multidrug transport system ATPase subunit